MIRPALYGIALAAILLSVTTTHSRVIKLGSPAPAGSPWDDGLRALAAEWSRISGGDVKLKIYPGGIAGNEDDMLRKMRIGQLDAAGLTGIGMSRVHSGILAVQLPLLVRTDEELHYVLDKMRPEFEEQLEKSGLKVLMWSTVGWSHFFSKRPVVTPSDLQEHKLFVTAGDAHSIQAWKDAGFHPVPLSFTDLMASLQSGMVEAFTMTPLTTASYQWFGLAKNMCGMNWAPLIGGVVISTKAWKKIPEKYRKPFMEAARKVGEQMQAAIDSADDKAVAVMKEHGLQVNAVTPEAVKKWKQATQEAFAKLAGKSFDAGSYEAVQRHLKTYRNQNAK
jgi:TRAP-type transport system periplasmic protein